VCTQTLRGILQRILELGLFLMDTHLAFLKLNSLKCNELIAQLEPRSHSRQEVLFVENKKEGKKKKENKHSHLKFTLCSNGVYEHYLCFEVNLSSYHYSWTYARHLRHLSRSFFSFFSLLTSAAWIQDCNEQAFQIYFLYHFIRSLEQMQEAHKKLLSTT